MPSHSSYVLLGDFNARVGSREGSDDPWWYERGPHGLGVMNEAGRELLSFLSINGATVCNMWFKKREVHKCTWQYLSGSRRKRYTNVHGSILNLSTGIVLIIQ